MEQEEWRLMEQEWRLDKEQELAQELAKVRFRPDMVAAVEWIDPLCKPNGVTPDVRLEARARSALFDRQPSTMRVAQGVHRGA